MRKKKLRLHGFPVMAAIVCGRRGKGRNTSSRTMSMNSERKAASRKRALGKLIYVGSCFASASCMQAHAARNGRGETERLWHSYKLRRLCPVKRQLFFSRRLTSLAHLSLFFSISSSAWGRILKRSLSEMLVSLSQHFARVGTRRVRTRVGQMRERSFRIVFA